MRRLTFVIGGTVLLVAWAGPLPELAPHSFSAHMMMHMLVVAVGAPMVAFGLSGGSFDLSKRAPRLLSPIPASVVELIVVWAWHAPALHHAARHEWWSFVAEQGMFFASGVWLWLSAFGISDAVSERRASGVVGLLLTSMHMTLLGALLALSPRPLYMHAEGLARLTPLDDQHLGGAIMLAIGGVAYLAGGLWLTLQLVRDARVEIGETP